MRGNTKVVINCTQTKPYHIGVQWFSRMNCSNDSVQLAVIIIIIVFLVCEQSDCYVSGMPCDWKPSPRPRQVCVVMRAKAYSLSSCANSSSWRRLCSSVSLLRSTLSSRRAWSSSRIPISLRNLAATLPSSSAANDDPVHWATELTALLSDCCRHHTAKQSESVSGGCYALPTWHWTGNALQMFVKNR